MSKINRWKILSTGRVRAIGIENIGMSEEVGVERAHFLKIYPQLAEERSAQEALLPEAQEYIRKQIGEGMKELEEKLQTGPKVRRLPSSASAE
jgi:hypothetical protein